MGRDGLTNGTSGRGPVGRTTDRHRAGDAGMSLVGLVIVLVLLGAMAVVVLKAVDGDEGTDPADAARPPATAIGAAVVAACQANVAVLRQAVDVAAAAGGTPAESPADLVRQGFLGEFRPPSGFTFELQPAADGAARQVLVNGLPADVGCRNGPTPG